MEIGDNCLHIKHPLTGKTFAFSILFPPVSYWKCALLSPLGHGQVGMLWKALSEGRSTWGLANAGPSTWRRPHFSVRIPEPADTLLCHPDNPVPCATLDSLYFVLNSESLRSPRAGLGHGSKASACRHLACRPPGPAQTSATLLPPLTSVGLAPSPSDGTPEQTSWTNGRYGHVPTEVLRSPPHKPSERLPWAVFTVASASYHRQRQPPIL